MPRLIHIIAANRWDQPWRNALDVCRHFKRQGWSVSVYTRDANAIDTRFRNADIDLRHSPLRGFFDFYSAIQLSADLKYEREGAIIHVHRYRDAFVALLARKIARRKDIRVVSTRHKMKRGKNHWLARRIYRNLDAQIFISKAVRDTFLSTWPAGRYPFPADRLHIITPTVDISAGTPAEEPSKGPKVILCQSTLMRGNGLETLIDAMTQLRNLKTRVWIMGDGDSDYIDTLRRRAQVRGVMEMIDWKLRPADNSNLVAQAHICVDPALSQMPFGPTHIACMAYGRAQVLSTSLSPSEYVADGVQAIIVPAGDAAALGQALKSLIENPEKRKEMGRAARNTYLGHFNWDSCVNALRTLYDSVRNTRNK